MRCSWAQWLAPVLVKINWSAPASSGYRLLRLDYWIVRAMRADDAARAEVCLICGGVSVLIMCTRRSRRVAQRHSRPS